jgi:phage FluMu gp28-like protein
VALSSRPSNLRGRQGVIVIDEAAFHEQLNELLKAALAMLIWGGQVRVISTHNGDTNPFNELVNDIRCRQAQGQVHRVDLQEAVADGLYRRVCLRLGKTWTRPRRQPGWPNVYAFYGDGADEELDCVPSNGSGAWLSRALIESRMSGRHAGVALGMQGGLRAAARRDPRGRVPRLAGGADAAPCWPSCRPERSALTARTSAAAATCRCMCR